VADRAKYVRKLAFQGTLALVRGVRCGVCKTVPALQLASLRPDELWGRATTRSVGPPPTRRPRVIVAVVALCALTPNP